MVGWHERVDHYFLKITLQNGHQTTKWWCVPHSLTKPDIYLVVSAVACTIMWWRKAITKSSCRKVCFRVRVEGKKWWRPVFCAPAVCCERRRRGDADVAGSVADNAPFEEIEEENQTWDDLQLEITHSNATKAAEMVFPIRSTGYLYQPEASQHRHLLELQELNQALYGTYSIPTGAWLLKKLLDTAKPNHVFVKMYAGEGGSQIFMWPGEGTA